MRYTICPHKREEDCELRITNCELGEGTCLTPSSTSQFAIRNSKFLILFLLVLILPACTQQMADQPRYDPLQKSDFYADRLSARPLPTGVISREYVEKEGLLD